MRIGALHLFPEPLRADPPVRPERPCAIRRSATARERRFPRIGAPTYCSDRARASGLTKGLRLYARRVCEGTDSNAANQSFHDTSDAPPRTFASVVVVRCVPHVSKDEHEDGKCLTEKLSQISTRNLR